MYLPIKISSDTGEGIEIVEVLLDSGGSGKFIDQDYAQDIHAEKKDLERPIQVYNVDGTPNKKRTITQYIELELEIHERKKRHQLLVTGLGNQQIILQQTSHLYRIMIKINELACLCLLLQLLGVPLAILRLTLTGR